MSNPFVLLYKLFESRKPVFYLLFLTFFSFLIYLSVKLVLKEDISAFIPKDQKLKKYQEVIQNLKANERIIISVSLKDSAAVDPELLTQYADALAEQLQARYDSTWLKEIKYKVDEETTANVFDLLYDHLPYYLEEEDYKKIETQLTDSSIYDQLRKNQETILSPEGTILKSFIIKDPLRFNNYALQKLARLQSEESFELYDGHFMTKDRKTLFLYLSIGYPANDSDKNTAFIKGLSELLTELSRTEYTAVRSEYFGSPAIAVANVSQIKQDAFLTTTVAIVVIFLGLLLYFRNLKTILLIFLPVLFGACFSLGLITLIRGEISAIALGAGSIVLGIAINYSLHFFTHLKHERSVSKVISDLTVPLTLGCTTTVGAFLCLHFMQSEALQDMGLFAALSLIGAAFCCLVILPQLSGKPSAQKEKEHTPGLLDKITAYSFHKNKVLLVLIIALTSLFLYTYDKVEFETDMTKLSYISPELEQAENNLDKLTNYKLKSVFLVSQGATLSEALQKNASAKPAIQALMADNVVKKYSDAGEFLLTDAARNEKIQRWNNFWHPQRVAQLREKLYRYGAEFRFKEAAFTPFLSVLTKNYLPQEDASGTAFKELFLQEYINEKETEVSVITVLKVAQENKSTVYKAFENFDQLYVIDRASMTTMFAKILNEDFNLILFLCSTLVFSFLFLSYGRIELALIAFLPMMISWIWILGIMGLFGVKFNIVNIILCTFMFGLGDDFSIFTLDGLEQEYKYGKNVLGSYRNSIILSAFTVIVGIGVLIVAKHPALQSIALVTIIGITCIVFVSLVIQPLLYGWLISERVRKGRLPITFQSMILSAGLIVYFFLGTFFIRLVSWISDTRTMHLASRFSFCLSDFILFTEQKCGEALAFPFLWKYIHWIPFSTQESLHNSYTFQKNKIAPTTLLRGRLIKNYVYKGPVVEWYSRIKTGLEDNYKLFDELLPKQGKIVDVGCGYGYLSYMLSLTAPEREITGIDYDEEKIAIAQNGVSRTDRLHFHASNVLDFSYEKSDAFVISDVLHYLTEEDQTRLIRQCLENLNQEGVLIIRDGNSEMQQRHQGTKLTEFFSTKLFGFNKVTVDKLYFTSSQKIIATVTNYPVSVETLDNTQFTSNIIFIIRHKKA